MLFYRGLLKKKYVKQEHTCILFCICIKFSMIRRFMLRSCLNISGSHRILYNVSINRTNSRTQWLNLNKPSREQSYAFIEIACETQRVDSWRIEERTDEPRKLINIFIKSGYVFYLSIRSNACAYLQACTHCLVYTRAFVRPREYVHMVHTCARAYVCA